jgi:uncharacterized membrane-anchored protein
MLTSDFLRAMLIGYMITIVIETLVLVVLLSRRHSMRVRVFAGVWLTLCTYPVVWLVLPPFFLDDQRGLYLLVAETFAPLAEVCLFWLAFSRWLPHEPVATRRDSLAIVVGNLCSFGLGEALRAFQLLATSV